jgi:flagellar hook-length control protein FliK
VTPVSDGNDAVKVGGDQTSTSIHGSDGSKSSSFTATIPTIATDAKDLLAQHANVANSGLGLNDSTGIVSAAGHPGVSGSFTASAAGSTSARATTSDAFTALDSAAAADRGVLLHAAPHQVAVGVSDPSLGWVEVRAERVSGQIAAALTTSSAASHAALTSVLPTMATYLQEHQAGVHQVHVETSLAGRQAGTGSQGQASSQNQAGTAPENLLAENAVTNSWNAGPVGSAAVTAARRNNFLHEGHFSIRA